MGLQKDGAPIVLKMTPSAWGVKRATGARPPLTHATAYHRISTMRAIGEANLAVWRKMPDLA